MGLEIVEQIPDLEAVVVPVGGAGLLAWRFVGRENLATARESCRC
jgi:threonine dehydratase